MANRTRHVGVIRPTVPRPQIFWGTIDEVAAHLGISRRATVSLLDGVTKSTRKGHRAMTEEEQEKYYQPPKPPKKKPSKRNTNYNQKMYWKITFFKDWKKGEPYPQEPDRIFSGTPQEFVRFTNCNIGQIYRLINWHDGNEEKYPLKSIKGWTIARIRRYTEPYKRKPRKSKESEDAA